MTLAPNCNKICHSKLLFDFAFAIFLDTVSCHALPCIISNSTASTVAQYFHQIDATILFSQFYWGPVCCWHLCTFRGNIFLSPDISDKGTSCHLQMPCALFCSTFILRLLTENVFELHPSSILVSGQPSYNSTLRPLCQQANEAVAAVDAEKKAANVQTVPKRRQQQGFPENRDCCKEWTVGIPQESSLTKVVPSKDGTGVSKLGD